MEITIRLSKDELTDILGDGFGQKVLEKLSTATINVFPRDSKPGESDQLTEDDKKTALIDDMSWVSFLIYDYIMLNHTDESEDYFLLQESEIKKSHDFNTGMIVGGCTQKSNRHNMPSFLKIFTPKKARLIGANKYYLPAFQNYKEEYLTDYEAEMKARNIDLPVCCSIRSN